MPNIAVVIENPHRLAAARRAHPADPAEQRIFQRLVELAAELADAPAGLLTIVEDREQVFMAHCGLPEELAEAGRTPIEVSLCQYAVARGRPLIIDDLSGDPAWRDHPAIRELGVRSYAGIPVVTGEGHAVGTLCVLDQVVRHWTDEVLSKLALLADIVSDELELQDHRRRAEFERIWRAIPEYRRR